MNSKFKAGIEIGVIIILFVFFSYFAQSHIDFLRNSIVNSPLGIAAYFLMVVIAVVIAPISAFPLHPVAANIWGWFLAGVVLWVAVCLGALIAFSLARRYGKNLVKKFVPIDKLQKIEEKIPEKNIFLSLILIRMILPIEIGSYFFGLFSNIRLMTYMIATIIGSAPLAFLSAYIGTLPVIFQINAVLGFLIIILAGLIVRVWKRSEIF